VAGNAGAQRTLLVGALARRRWRASAELALLLGSVLASLWLVPTSLEPVAFPLVGVAVLAIGLVSHHRRRATDPNPAVGAARANLEAAAAAAVLVAGVFAWTLLIREPYETARFAVLDRNAAELLMWLLRRLVLALTQQVTLQLILVPLVVELVGSGRPSLAACALIFGACHLPSPTLAVLTAVAGGVWVALYRRGRRLVPLVITHAILWFAAYSLVPARLTADMSVGHAAAEFAPLARVLDDPRSREILRDVSSAAYQAHAGDEAGYIRALYRDMLGRTPGENEVAYWLGERRSESRSGMAQRFVLSQEMRDLRSRLGERYRFPYRPAARAGE
jgi:hypothetical protein